MQGEEGKRICNGCEAIIECHIIDDRYVFYSTAEDKEAPIKDCPKCGALLNINTTAKDTLNAQKSSAPQIPDNDLGFTIENAERYRKMAEEVRIMQNKIRYSVMHELPRDKGSFHLIGMALELHNATASNLETLSRLMRDGVEGLYKPLS